MAPPRAKAPRTSRPLRRGSALVYVTVSMVALLAFVSLAVDLGHVYVVRSELQTAADAAARYGATGIADGVSTAQAYAVNSAKDNTSDGVAVTVDPNNDVEFGTWDKTARSFTVLSGAARSSANAIRVTARRTAATNNAVSLLFARVLGKTSQDVRASSIAFVEKDNLSGIVGFSSITLKNNTFIASYNSAVTTDPNPNTSSSTGKLLSNGSISGGNNNDLNGGIVLGPGAPNVSGINVSGSTTNLTSALVPPAEPAWNPVVNPGGVPQSYTATGNVTLPGGTYTFTSLTVTGALTFSGPVTMTVNGPIVVGGSLQAYNLIPANLKIYQLGPNTFTDSNNIDMVADIIAPNVDFVAKNKLTFRGRMIMKSITLQNNGDIYYDVTLGGSGTGTGPLVVTVR